MIMQCVVVISHHHKLCAYTADGLTRHWDEHEYGPHLSFREHSFMNQTGVPEDFRSSAINVIVCQKGKGYCPEPDAPGTVDINKVFLQEHLKSEHIRM